jgi:transcription elongation factor Elf1
MHHIKLSYGPNFTYLLFFTCPDCNHLFTLHYSSESIKTEAQLKNQNHLVACDKCNFKGMLVGSAIEHVVELEHER